MGDYKNEKTNDLAAATGAVLQEEDGNSGIRTAETLLRLFPVGLCVAALVIMIKDSENNEYGSLSYSNITAFRYLRYVRTIYLICLVFEVGVMNMGLL